MSMAGSLPESFSDPRGIFVGSLLIGPATVIVKNGDQYAFFRGKGAHQPARCRVPAQTNKTFKAWDNNLQFNGQNRVRQVEWLQRKVLENKQKGVEVYRTK
jgi:hypothetical protein